MSIHSEATDPARIADDIDVLAIANGLAGDRPIAVVLGDLDGFAGLNEELGRDAGDAAIGAFIRTVSGSIPDGTVMRTGGDEFVAFLPDVSPENALIVFDEIRSHLAEHPVEGIGRTISATFGVAGRPPHASTLEDLMRCANAALMRGKREGGGRVTMYVEEKMVLKSNYYRRADLDRLGRLSTVTGRTEASLLREALDDLFTKYRDEQ